MANIGRAYGRIMPMVAALLRDVLLRVKKKKKEKKGKEKEKERTIENDTENAGSRQMFRMFAVGSVYAWQALFRSLEMYIKNEECFREVGVTRNASYDFED